MAYDSSASSGTKAPVTMQTTTQNSTHQSITSHIDLHMWDEFTSLFLTTIQNYMRVFLIPSFFNFSLISTVSKKT